MLQGTRGVASGGDAVGAFLTQFYEGDVGAPPEILVPEPIPDLEVIERWLGERRGGRVRIVQPQRGERARLVAMARENAALHLAQERGPARRGPVGPGARELAGRPAARDPAGAHRVLRHQQFPGRRDRWRRWSSAEGGRVKKRDYRRLQDEDHGGPRRRGDDARGPRPPVRAGAAGAGAARPRRADPAAKWAVLPDVVLLDGGRGQLSAARDVLFEYNHMIPAIALAKGQDLAHHRHVVRALRGLHLEAPVLARRHAAALRDDHRRHGLAALEIADIVALDAYRRRLTSSSKWKAIIIQPRSRPRERSA